MNEGQIYRKLHEAREEKSLSYQKLSNLTGMGLTHLYNAFNGKHSLGLQNLLKICKALDLEIVVRKRADKASEDKTAHDAEQ